MQHALTELKNREKAVIIGALREKYTLPMLLTYFHMARSSYYYQQAVMNKPDKYLPFRGQIASVFHENRGVYGYRRIHLALKRKGITLSEKVIRHIMKEEGLAVFVPKRAKYSSYLGEITPEVDNIISRDFHAKQPYEKLLTDITEFALPDGMLYLSAMIDCFDGMVIGWTIGSRPNADLVNTMLDRVIAELPDGCYPTVHSDRGCHYRWPGWIQRMRKAGLTRSMSKKGCSPDNAACEGFFGRLKNEMFYGRSWIGVSPNDFAQELDDYINWYSGKGHRNQLSGNRNPSTLADTDYDGQKHSYNCYPAANGRNNGCYQHKCNHNSIFGCTGDLHQNVCHFSGNPCMEQSRANHHHGCNKDNRTSRKSAEQLTWINNPTYNQHTAAQHRDQCRRKLFRYKKDHHDN